MSSEEFYTLKRYAMKMTDDVEDRDELVLLAWQESMRLGARSSMPILVNFMKLRARNCDRSIAGAELGGKSKMDLWRRKPLSLSMPVGKDRKDILGDLPQSSCISPFDATVAGEFLESLDKDSRKVLVDLDAGYTHQEIRKRHRLSLYEFYKLRDVLKDKAREYLV